MLLLLVLLAALNLLISNKLPENKSVKIADLFSGK